MAFVFVDVNAKCDLPIYVCDRIYVCLVSPWEDRTKSGYPLVEARVVRIDELCEEQQVTNCCSTTTTCARSCRYRLEINNDQFLQDPSTLKPYEITTDDISEMIPYTCLISKLTAHIDALPDHVLDTENTTLVHDDVANTSTFTLPVIDRVNDISVGTATLVLPGGSLVGDNPTSTATYTSAAGETFSIDIGDLFESQIDGVTITRNPGTGIYSAVSAAPDLSLVVNDNCSTQGANGDLVSSIAVLGHEITVNRHPAPYAISEIARFAGQQYVGAPAVSTLQTGDSNIQTPAFVSTVVNNPSTCLDMRVTITVTGSFACNSTSGTGFVVFGHTLWVDGVKIADRNGRSNAGFNVSWADGINVLEDFTLPTIVYSHTIPAGGSVTVGIDFGDSDTFATVGTATEISLESRQIEVSGSTI